MKRYLLIIFGILCLNSQPLLSKSHFSYKKYDYQLSVCLMFQNEARFMREWIEYYKLIGAEHFYLYNNSSTDNFMEVLAPYVISGEVELFHYPVITDSQAQHHAIQCDIYNDAISRCSNVTKWLAIVDGDEFILPVKENSLLEVLKDYENYGGVYVNWLNFGTSDVEKIPDGKLMIEMLNHCQDITHTLGKSIVRPDRVSGCSDPHRLWYHPPYCHVNTDYKIFDWICPIATDKLVIHHYCTGDLYHLINVKFPRRKKWIAIELGSYIEGLKILNTVENNAMSRFISPLRAKMGLPDN